MMRAPSLRRLRPVFVVGVICMVGAPPAGAETVATFADPSGGSGMSLFQLSGSTLTGGWSGTGLTLVTPINNQVYPDTTFSMTPTEILNPGVLDSGALEFRSSSNALLLRLEWQQAELASFGWGASSFMASGNVDFSGDIITYPLEQEWFSFGFANPALTPNGYSWTAAFTSSATPEPGTVATLLLAALCRRRR